MSRASRSGANRFAARAALVAARLVAMRLDDDALDALDALENLLNAESADVVNDVLDDACKAWCDGAREGEEKRAQRLRKNCEKIKEKLEVASDDEALRTTRACETVVRMSVWALGASDGERASMGFERAVTHEKLRALLVERALERRGKWREKIASARAMPAEALKDFDWCVRGTTGGVSGASRSASDASASTCRFALRLRRGGAPATAPARDVRFRVGVDALDVIVGKCADARRAIETLAPAATPES